MYEVGVWHLFQTPTLLYPLKIHRGFIPHNVQTRNHCMDISAHAIV